MTPPPASFSLKPYVSKIGNQGALNTCVTNAGTLEIETLLTRAGQFRDLSRLFAYWVTRQREATQDRDVGVILADFFFTLSLTGICDESIWPYDPAMVEQKPSDVACAAAVTLKPTRYEDCGVGTDGAMDNWSYMIASGVPVVIAMNITIELFYLTTGETYHGTSTAPFYGRHGMCIIGYDETGFVVENSWGQEWGDQGCFHLDFDVAKADVFDAWACTELSGVTIPQGWTPTMNKNKLYLDDGATFSVGDECHIVGSNIPATVTLLPTLALRVMDSNVGTLNIPHLNRCDIGLRAEGNQLQVYQNGTMIALWSIGGGQTMVLKDGSNAVGIIGLNQITFGFNNNLVSTVTPQ
jgi:hypothetical protein